MVIVYLCGGLGNQLFQYALGRHLALLNDTELFFDVRSFSINSGRVYELVRYPVTGTIAPAGMLARITKPSALDRMFHSRRILTVKERSFRFDAQVLAERGNCYLHGYWQSERYFKDIRATVLNELSPRLPALGINHSVLDEIDSSEAVAVHVRRGDYVADPKVNSVHGTCSLDYYRAAFERMNARLSSPRYFIFSDDPAWVKENLRPDNARYCEHNGPDAGFEDLRLMSHCRHHIIANSSFSWWGAWLGTHPEQRVIAPARWFAGGTEDTTDLIPARWERL